MTVDWKRVGAAILEIVIGVGQAVLEWLKTGNPINWKGIFAALETAILDIIAAFTTAAGLKTITGT